MANEFKIKNGLIVSGSAEVEQNLTVRGTLTADEFHVSVVTSSILYESGSTRFGDTLDDNHDFTGSVNITGSITLNGQAIGTGKLDETTFNSFTSSYTTVSSSLDSRLDVLEAYSGSQQVPTASYSLRTSQTDVYCKNITGVQINKGSVVRVVDSIGDNPIIALADNSSESQSANVLGIATVDIPHDSFGEVITQGIFVGVNTSGMTAGALLFLGTSGSITTTPPTAPNHGVRLGEVLRVQQNNGSILVNVDNGIELNEAHDVIYTGITTGDLLIRSGSVWKNGKALNGAYELTGSLNATGTIYGSNIVAIETATSSLNSFTSSINTTIKTNLDVENVVSGSSQIIITGTTGYSTFSSSISATTSNLSGDVTTLSSSIATTDLNQTNRLSSIESKTGSYATTGSNLFIGNQTISGSIIPSVDNAYDLGSSTHQWRDVYISSGSLYIDGTKVIGSTTQELTITTDTGQSIKILEAGTDSIILQTADGDIELKSSGGGDVLLDPTNGIISIKGTTQIQDGYKITSSGGTNIVFADGIIVSGSIELTGTIDGIDLQALSSSVNTRIGNLEGGFGSLNTFTASAAGRLTAIETATSSLNSFTSSINTTIKSKLDSEGVISGSAQVILTGTTGYSTFSSSISASIGSLSGSVATTTSGLSSSIGSLSSSVATTTLNTKNRVDSIESKTGSYATTGSNIFQGDQTITGSLYVSQNLIVQGSSSITYVTSSQLRVEDNIITVNTSNPGQRFGGLEVYDSGSVTQATGSILWDSQNNRWIYQQSSEATYGGGVLMSGPRSSGSLGSELTLTNNRVAKSAGGDHLNDSNITDSGTLVSINSNTEITGTLLITSTIVSQGTSLVSGSAQISYAGITNIPSGIVSGAAQVTPLLPAGTVSGSSQVLVGSTVWSSSAQLPSGIISGAAQLPAGTVSGSSQVLNGSGVWSGSAQLPSGIVSGSSQITFGSISGVPGGLVSGSSQIDLTSTTNYSSGILTRLNAVGVFSGSAQVSFGSISGVPSGLVSGSSQVLSGTGIWSGSAQLPSGVISGSAQVISALPSGTVSGSAQISFSGIAGVPSGLVSGSSQVLSGTGIWSGSAQLPSGVVSGSSQITFGSISGVPSGLVSGSSQVSFGSISGVPSGLVSGSSQITLSSTTGFGSYLNQAVLTSSSPSFSSIYSSAAGGFYLGDTGAGLYRDNTYDVVLTQNNSSGYVTYISGAGNVIVSIDNNNNETDRKFIVGNNAVKATNELFSVNESGTVYVAGYLTVNGSGTSSSIYMSDSDEGNREIHCNSNRIGFLTQSGSWGSFCHDDGYWQSDMSVRAPIFYDSQDTGYYVDPNGTSNIYTLTVNNQVNHNTSSSRAKYHVYGSDGLYCIGMQSSVTYGGLNDWSMTFQFNNETDRGFWWGHNGHSTAQGAMALTTNGNLTVARRIRVGYGESDVSDPTVPLQVYGSGGTVFDVQGSAGQLFSVTDDLTGDIFAISDISGVPMINVNTTNGTSFGSTIFPSANNAYDLGTSSYRWANVYTNDLHLSNEGKVGGNDVDGTTGNWTIQEGAEQLYIINNKNGKKYKINLTEI